MFNFKKDQAQRSKTGKTTDGKNALSMKEPQMTVSSLELAEITGKNHKELLRSIRDMQPAWEKVTERKFALSEYKDITGRKLPMYQFDKLEYMYIISKFNDEIRALLIKRWYELEMELRKPKRGVKLYEHEKTLFDILNNWLCIGDIKKVALELGVTPNSVSRVKRGIFRSRRIMEALIDQCKYNKDMGLSNGYSKSYSWVNDRIFNPSNQLKMEL